MHVIHLIHGCALVLLQRHSAYSRDQQERSYLTLFRRLGTYTYLDLVGGMYSRLAYT